MKCPTTTTVWVVSHLLLQCRGHQLILTSMHSSIHFLVKSFHTTPAMNTRAGKKVLQCLFQDHPEDLKDNNFYLYLLPQALEQVIIYMLQENSPTHTLGYIRPNLREEHRHERQRKQEMAAIGKRAELLVKMKELQFTQVQCEWLWFSGNKMVGTTWATSKGGQYRSAGRSAFDN